jgi:FAD binding domain
MSSTCWKLALAADGHAGAKLLDSYHAERHPIAARVIKVTTDTTNAGTVSNPLVRRLRNRAVRIAGGLALIAQALADETEETSVAYRHSPIADAPRGPRTARSQGTSHPTLPASSFTSPSSA